MQIRYLLAPVFAMSFLSLTAQTKLGIGLGTRGLVIKAPPQQFVRYSFRFRPDIEFFFAFDTDLDVGLNLIREEKANFYVGLG